MTSPIGALAAKTLRTRHERTVFANRDELPMRVTKANKEIPAQFREASEIWRRRVQTQVKR